MVPPLNIISCNGMCWFISEWIRRLLLDLLPRLNARSSQHHYWARLVALSSWGHGCSFFNCHFELLWSSKWCLQWIEKSYWDLRVIVTSLVIISFMIFSNFNLFLLIFLSFSHASVQTQSHFRFATLNSRGMLDLFRPKMLFCKFHKSVSLYLQNK